MLFKKCCVMALLAVQPATPAFEPMQPDLLGAGSNFTNAFADYDNDGDLDMFVGFDGKPNRQLIAGLSTHVSIDTSK